jgi:DNA-binding response OmpR family regulator
VTHIVLVEDDELLSEMYQAALISEGFQCSVALDGATGLDLVEHTQPDLVLLDLMLPQMSGDEVLAKIRQSERIKDTKVIIMTNISETEASDVLKTLDFERYIVKANTTLLEVVEIVKQLFKPPDLQPEVV